MLRYLVGGTAAWDPNPFAHLLAKLPLTSKAVWPDGELQAVIWLDEQLRSITIIYDVLLAAPNAHRFNIHLLGWRWRSLQSKASASAELEFAARRL